MTPSHTDPPLLTVCALVDKADALACQFIQPDKPFSKQVVFEHVRPLMPETAGVAPAMMDGIVWDVVTSITENALRSIQDSAQ